MGNIMNSIKAFAQLIRLPNLFTAASNIIAAHIVVTQGEPQWALLALTLLASLFFYHGGMILNDCIDIDEDRQERPNRPLPAGLMSLAQAWGLSIGLMLLGLVICYQLSNLTFYIACGLVVTIFTYNLSSRTGYFGCVAMGACRLLNWCLALSVATGFVTFWPYALLVGIYVGALTLISRDETQANRAELVNYCAIFMVLGTLFFLITLWLQNVITAIGAVILMIGLAVILIRLAKLKAHYNTANIQGMVMFLVLGLIPLDAVLVLVAGFPIAAIFIFILLLPSRFLARRLYVT